MRYCYTACVVYLFYTFIFVICPCFSFPQPSKDRVREDWEVPFIFGMSAFFVLSYVVLTQGPNTNIAWWAREEALHTNFKVPQPAPDLED